MNDTMSDSDMVSPNATEWQGMAAERKAVIIEGVKAMRTHRDGLKRALAIGRAFDEIQLEAMLRAHCNEPIGKAYNQAFNALEKPVPELQVNKTERNQYLWCWRNKDELQQWWDTIGEKEALERRIHPNNQKKRPNQRDKWNHPDAIKRNFEKAQAGEKEKDEGAVKPLTPSQRKDAEIARLQEELDTAERKLRHIEQGKDNITEGQLWTWGDSAKDIGDAWYAINPTKAAQAASRVLDLNKGRNKKPTIRRPKQLLLEHQSQ